MSTAHFDWIDLPSQENRAREVQSLLTRVAEADGVEPLSESFVGGVTDARLGHRHLVVLIDDRVVAVAALAGSDAELCVDPDFRRRGIARELVLRLRDEQDSVGIWAHGNLPPARGLAAAMELSKKRRLLVMAVAGTDLSGADARVPEGYEVLSVSESSDRWGRDVVEQAWLDANNDAFSWHPEQGGWDLDRLHRAQEAQWYSDEDVLLLWRRGSEGESDPNLAGFHWTKWQSADHRHGEVYVVGLAGGYRGRGLGRVVVSMGLAHLVSGGAREVILYVEDDNVAAVRQYEKLGFTVAEEHVVYG